MINFRDNPEGPAAPAPLLPDRAEAIFQAGGWLQQTLGLEYRPQQEAMALRVAQAFAADAPLLFEAGTGVGKSLAYLIPGLLFALASKRPLVVSTHTIALQEQIQKKDLPLIRDFFLRCPALAEAAGFKVALLVGRGNYVCQTRLARALQGQRELLDSGEQEELRRIAAWAADTPTGLRHELHPAPSPEVWDQVNADASACNRKECGLDGCSYRRARREVEAAHVRIVNHSLLFSLLHAGAGVGGDRRGILFPDDVVVLDEAHTLPGIASEHFGLGVSSFGVAFALKRLFNPARNKGFLTRWGRPADCDLVARALAGCEEFFLLLREQYLRARDTVRLREPGWADAAPLLPLKQVIDRLGTLEARTNPEDQILLEFRDHRGRLTSAYDGLLQAIALAEDKQVYWLERAGRRQPIVHVRSAPLDPAPLLHEAIFARRTGVVLTSATLALNGSLEDFATKVGAWGVEGAIEASPFDYPRRTRILIASDPALLQAGPAAPLPAAPSDPPAGSSAARSRPRREAAQINGGLLARYLLACIRAVPGGSLVLFTSYADLDDAALRLAESLEADGRPFFRQGEGRSRTELARAFRQAGHGVLFGTESFWTGIDVPGPALSQVIITRLPFENPSHPVAEARAEWIRARGGNPFAAMTLPEAVVKFRQGLGRLIRSRTDSGWLVILDPRVLQREYGKIFLSALPQPAYLRLSLDNLPAAYRNPPEGFAERA